MTAHIARASSNDEIRGCLASFTQDAERSLAAVYHCFEEIYGDRAARSTAEAWLRILEERLEEPGELLELTAIRAAAIAFSVSNLVKPPASHSAAHKAWCPHLGNRNLSSRADELPIHKGGCMLRPSNARARVSIGPVHDDDSRLHVIVGV
jgi:hypothetical protein